MFDLWGVGLASFPLSLSLARPPSGWRVKSGNLGCPQRDQVAAFVGVATNLRAVLAAHLALQFVDGCCLRPADDIQRHRLVSVAAEAADLKVEISGVQGVSQRRGVLSRALVSKHPLVPSLTRQPVSFLARFLRALRGRRGPNCRKCSRVISCPFPKNALPYPRSASRYQLGSEQTAPQRIAGVDKMRLVRAGMRHNRADSGLSEAAGYWGFAGRPYYGARCGRGCVPAPTRQLAPALLRRGGARLFRDHPSRVRSAKLQPKDVGSRPNGRSSAAYLAGDLVDRSAIRDFPGKRIILVAGPRLGTRLHSYPPETIGDFAPKVTNF
jgi:hypothetical protein